ncbi:SAM-dependent methyltransferase [Rhodovulum sp. P5]|uniref:DUF938 domain-containing protein n=1 Tax=Rhodovulum sp. P5 TaxID=1564506 RepID=UPI0009C22501|nr:DUF938 domain-containing protein [Rhodovulum sp. P5]ARE39757.1 SAM-dependent methyltransferase [Rhodovulum sp. P5]
MPRRLNLPDSASVAIPRDNDRLHAPSAARNGAAICAVISERGPKSGRALEIASGTGEHAIRIAACLPDVIWQPTDIDPTRRKSIDAWNAGSDCANIRPAIALDACTPGWGAKHGGQDLIFASNILHLISESEAETLIVEASHALSPGGMLMIYGPFRREHGFATDSDAAFHASLTAQDPEIGYKSIAEVHRWMENAGLTPQDPSPMPAENVTLVGINPL